MGDAEDVPRLQRRLAEALVQRDQLQADVEALCISQAEAGSASRKGASGKVWTSQFLQLESRCRKAEEGSLTALRDAERLEDELKGHKSALGQLQAKLREEMRVSQDLRGEVSFYMKQASSALADRDAEAAEKQSARDQMAEARGENARLARDLEQAEEALAAAEREFAARLLAEHHRTNEAAGQLAEMGARLEAAERRAAGAEADAEAAQRDAGVAREAADRMESELEEARGGLRAAAEDGLEGKVRLVPGDNRKGTPTRTSRAVSFFFGRAAGAGDGGPPRGAVGGGGPASVGDESLGGQFVAGVDGTGQEATIALLVDEASRLKDQVEAADEARDDVVRELSQATKEKLEALVELAQEGERRRRDAVTIDQLQRQCAELQKKVDKLTGKPQKPRSRNSKGEGSGGGTMRPGGVRGGDEVDGLAAGAGATGDSDRSHGTSASLSSVLHPPGPETPKQGVHGTPGSGSFISRMFGAKGGGSPGLGLGLKSTPGSELTPAEAERRIADLTLEVAAVKAELDRIRCTATTTAVLRSQLVPSDAVADLVEATDFEPPPAGDRDEDVIPELLMSTGAGADSVWDVDGEAGVLAISDSTDTVAAATIVEAAHRHVDIVHSASHVAEEARLLRLALGDAGGDTRGSSEAFTGCVEMAELAYLAARLQERCGRAERELAKLRAASENGAHSLEGSGGFSPRQKQVSKAPYYPPDL